MPQWFFAVPSAVISAAHRLCPKFKQVKLWSGSMLNAAATTQEIAPKGLLSRSQTVISSDLKPCVLVAERAIPVICLPDDGDLDHVNM